MNAGDVPEKTARYRKTYRDGIGRRYRPHVHLALTTFAALAAAGLAMRTLSDVQNWEWWALPLSFFAANGAEYFGHRYPMHHVYGPLKSLCRRHAGEHHRFYTHLAMGAENARDWHIVLAPAVFLVFFIGIIAVPLGVLLFIVTTKNVGCIFVTVAALYAGTYEWMHLAYHQAPDSAVGRLPFMATLRQLHTTHHNPGLMTKQNFNITFPIFDAIMGTLHHDERRGRPPPASPLG